MNDTPELPIPQEQRHSDDAPRGSAVPYPLSAFERRAPSTRASRGGASGLLLPWHSSPRHEGLHHEGLHHEGFREGFREGFHETEQPALQPPTHGALALWPELALAEEPSTYVEPYAGPRRETALRSIMVVEDDAHLARALQSALELDGDAEWSVTVAADGARALELAAANPPQIVLLDILLPGLDGVEVYRRLRAAPTTQYARVVFISAATSLDLHERGIRDGVLLRKPFDPRELVRLVRGLLAQAETPLGLGQSGCPLDNAPRLNDTKSEHGK